MNPYEILGVDKKASPGDIKKAFRALASLNHPDRNPVGAERMQRINEANDILSDPDKRRRYDETGETVMQSAADRVEREATEQVLNLLNALIDKADEQQLKTIDVVQQMRENIRNGTAQCQQERRRIRNEIRKLRQVKRRLKSDNFIFAANLRQRGKRLFDAWKATRHAQKVLARMVELIEDADYSVEAQAVAFYATTVTTTWSR